MINRAIICKDGSTKPVPRDIRLNVEFRTNDTWHVFSDWDVSIYRYIYRNVQTASRELNGQLSLTMIATMKEDR